MRFPQTINPLLDTVVAIDGTNVIDDTTQLPLGPGETVIQVDMHFLSINDGAHYYVEDITMTYSSDVDHWTIDVADFKSTLRERHKFVGIINKNTEESIDMRTIKILQFSYEEDGLELTLMRYPYEIVVGESDAYFIWYEDGHIGEFAYRKYIAPAYQEGEGTTFATDPSKVTHRGAIAVWQPF